MDSAEQREPPYRKAYQESFLGPSFNLPALCKGDRRFVEYVTPFAGDRPRVAWSGTPDAAVLSEIVAGPCAVTNHCTSAPATSATITGR